MLVLKPMVKLGYPQVLESLIWLWIVDPQLVRFFFRSPIGGPSSDRDDIPEIFTAANHCGVVVGCWMVFQPLEAELRHRTWLFCPHCSTKNREK